MFSHAILLSPSLSFCSLYFLLGGMSTPPKSKKPDACDRFDDHLRRHDYVEQHWERARSTAVGNNDGGDFPTTPVKGTNARAAATAGPGREGIQEPAQDTSLNENLLQELMAP